MKRQTPWQQLRECQRAQQIHWLPINTLDLTQIHFVMVTEDGMVRIQFWDGQRWNDGTAKAGAADCLHPTHWMPVPIGADNGL